MNNPVRLHILASGSSANAAILAGPQGWILIDIGLPASDLRRRIAETGLEPADCKACILTHTHGDHWKDSGLSWLSARNIPLWLHPGHFEDLSRQSRAIHTLKAANSLREITPEKSFQPLPGTRVTPTEISHDSAPTLGFHFRVTDPDSSSFHEKRIGYFADLGKWTRNLTRYTEGLHILALEFNHQPELLESSGRPDFLKRRIAGPRGHLSNAQAGEVVANIRPDPWDKKLVLLHLSRECNTPTHALQEATQATNAAGGSWNVTVSNQDAITEVEASETENFDAECGPLFQDFWRLKK